MLLVFLSCLTVEGRCGGGITYQDTAPSMLLVFLSCLTVEGRCGGGIACQDALKHIHVSLVW